MKRQAIPATAISTIHRERRASLRAKSSIGIISSVIAFRPLHHLQNLNKAACRSQHREYNGEYRRGVQPAVEQPSETVANRRSRRKDETQGSVVRHLGPQIGLLSRKRRHRT